MRLFKVTCLSIILLLCLNCKDGTNSTVTSSAVNNTAMLTKLSERVKEKNWEVLSSRSQYNSLMKLIKQINMVDKIKTLDDVTFFAPTNKAINELRDETYSALRAPENQFVAQQFLSYHLVKGSYSYDELVQRLKQNKKPLRLKTIQGAYLSLLLSATGQIKITDQMGTVSEISGPNVETINGVILGINAMLVPQIPEKLKE
jgi:uncharacterized surface protein with fasciclin (FAS1) repeats